MKKRNIIAVMLFAVLFLGSIYVCFVNNDRIKDSKNKSESLKIQLETLTAENDTLVKTNSELLKTNSSLLEKVNNLKDVTN